MIANNKILKTLFIAAMTLLLVIPMGNFVIADSIGEQQKGKTYVKDAKSSNSIPLDRDRVREIDSALNRGDLSTTEKEQLQDELNQIEKDLMQWFAENRDPVKEEIAREKQALLEDILRGDSGSNEERKLLRAIPITTLGYDYVDNTLEITIDPEKFNASNVAKYIADIRTVIGDKVDLTVSPTGYITSTACSDRNSFCDEPEGGMEYGVNSDVCTIGFRATLNGNVGFVTAGHCLDGQEEEDVDMPVFGTVIGTVTAELYEVGQTVNCDCGFVTTDDEVVDMSDNIFGTQNPNSIGTVSLGNQVQMSGSQSGVQTGYVTDTGVSFFNTDDSFITNHVEASYASTGGDSGAPVINGNIQLVGIHTHRNQEGTIGYFEKEATIRDSEDGLGITWDF